MLSELMRNDQGLAVRGSNCGFDYECLFRDQGEATPPMRVDGRLTLVKPKTESSE